MFPYYLYGYTNGLTFIFFSLIIIHSSWIRSVFHVCAMKFSFRLLLFRSTSFMNFLLLLSSDIYPLVFYEEEDWYRNNFKLSKISQYVFHQFHYSYDNFIKNNGAIPGFVAQIMMFHCIIPTVSKTRILQTFRCLHFHKLGKNQSFWTVEKFVIFAQNKPVLKNLITLKTLLYFV